MRKVLKCIVLPVVSLMVIMLMMLTACADPALKEVAGTYELTSISGTINGITVTKDTYEYYRIILGTDGKATVESKGAGSSSTYEAQGTYKYEDGKIKLITKSGAASVTEEMDYADGVITYVVNQAQMNITLTLTRAE